MDLLSVVSVPSPEFSATEIPDFDRKHYTRVDTPEECIWLLGNTFLSPIFWAIAPVYGYLEWYTNHERLQPTTNSVYSSRCCRRQIRRAAWRSSPPPTLARSKHCCKRSRGPPDPDAPQPGGGHRKPT